MHCGAQRARGIGGGGGRVVEVGAGEGQQPPVGPLPSQALTCPTPRPSEPSSFLLQGPSPVGQSQTSKHPQLWGCPITSANPPGIFPSRCLAFSLQAVS